MRRVPLLPEHPRPLLFAHRGCSSLAPENTMEAFTLAKNLGSPGLELDVHLCKSGHLVVLHDDNLLRTTGIDRPVEDCTWDELKHLDAGSWKDPRFSHSRLPLLHEVLDTFLPDIYVDIELKTRKSSADPLPEAVAALLESFGRRAEGHIAVSSFNPLALRSFRKRSPQVPTAIIWCDDAELPAYLRHGEGRWLSACDYLKPIHHKVNRGFTFMLGTLGQRPLVPWTVDSPDVAKILFAQGIQGIITNKPQDILPVVKELSHG